MFKPIPFVIDNDRFYYEPRALWSVARVGTARPLRSQFQAQGYLPLPKEDYRNGSRWPIRITHALISPIGYLYRDGIAASDFYFDQCMAGIGRMSIRIAFPKSSWIERLDTDVLSFATEPAAEPGTNDYRSGLFGVSRWTFEPSLIIPRKVSLDLIFSTIQGYTIGEADPTGSLSAIFFERGGRMLGHARNRPAADLEYGPSWHATGQTATPWPASQTATLGDEFAENIGLAGTQGQTFPAAQKWPSNLYWHQLGSRGLPYTEVTGFAVAIDQIDIDDQYFNEGPPVGITAPRLAPIAQRIITKASCRDGGTQERWWRDGAPLSLVTPTLNNCAFVHKFDDPFILGPGEGLEVGLQAPKARHSDIDINLNYNVGVSFLGYACVEDNDTKVYR